LDTYGRFGLTISYEIGKFDPIKTALAGNISCAHVKSRQQCYLAFV